MPFESLDTRILNLTRNCRLKRHQAEARVAAGVAGWVVKGESIRELSLREIMDLRAQRGTETIDPSLAASELPGLVWQPPTSQRGNTRRNSELIRAAYEFANETAERQDAL